MNLSRTDDQKILLHVSEAEFFILKSCLREVFAAIDKRAFPSRIGASSEAASKLADEIHKQAEDISLTE